MKRSIAILLASALISAIASAATVGSTPHSSMHAPGTPHTPFAPDAATSQSAPQSSSQAFFNICDFGAVPDDGCQDSAAINAAIEAAEQHGGGTVVLPAGTWDCFTIHMKSNVTIMLSSGCTVKAARPTETEGYVAKNADGSYPKWCNALFYGEGVHDAGVIGSGRIDGSGVLTRGFGSDIPYPVPSRIFTVRESRNLLFRDFSVTMGGARVLWLVAADNVTIDNLRIDSNRDGIDVDCCHNVHISNCTVNCLNDDAIVLKSAYTLGVPRACENISIVGCHVSGYDPGTVLSGEYGRTIDEAPDLDGPTGRIKLGTESVGGFRNITITGCVFDRSRGIAMECVDGGVLEDVSVNNVTMREVSNSPFFIRLGNRGRGPAGRGPGIVRRINISNLIVKEADCKYASIIAGIPGHYVEDVHISNVHIQYRGGLSMADAQNQLLSNNFFTAEGISGKGGPNSGGLPTKAKAEDILPREAYDIPECETSYPEPAIFGVLPAYGLFVRHARRISFDNIVIETMEPDQRPAILLMDVEDIEFDGLTVRNPAGSRIFVKKGVKGLRVR